MTKFQKLTKREKVEHVWEYYRYHIVGGVFAVFIVSSILMQIFGPRPAKPAARVVVMGSYYHDIDKVEQFQEEIQDIINTDEGGTVELDMYLVDWSSTSPMDVAMNQKLMLMFQAKEIDVMIVEEGKFNSYITDIEDSIYESLEGQPTLKATLEASPENLVKRKLEGDTEERVYGLYSKNNKKLQDIGLGDDFIISVPVISDNKENAFEVIKWLYE